MRPFKNSLGFKVENGRKMNFWKDKWCGVEGLCTFFSVLFGTSWMSVCGGGEEG